MNPYDDIFNIFEDMLQMGGQKFKVERNHKIIASYDGLTNTKENGIEYIGFRPNTDIQLNDWLINSAGERFLVTNRKTKYTNGEPNELVIDYITESEHINKQNQTIPTVFNIENANGAAIGNYNNISISYPAELSKVKDEVQNSASPDKAELERVVELLEMIINNEIPASKGIFSKFTSVMERNSWITNAIANALLSWLTHI